VALVDLSNADVVDAHCHPYRVQELLTRDPAGFETRCMFLGTALLSSNRAAHDLTSFVEELTETTVFGLSLRRWLAAFLDCEPTKDAVANARDQALRVDPIGYARRLLDEEHVTAVVADEGYPQPTIPREEFEAVLAREAADRLIGLDPVVVEAALGALDHPASR
jgi:hypothetical protein